MVALRERICFYLMSLREEKKVRSFVGEILFSRRRRFSFETSLKDKKVDHNQIFFSLDVRFPMLSGSGVFGTAELEVGEAASGPMGRARLAGAAGVNV